MAYMSSGEIKGEFLDFFQSKGHLKIDEASVIPDNDPTLLYINSGMAPLKKYFTGETTPPAQELTNAQTCIRTNDIDDVGDQHHGTSFTMLGSWSIGGYRQEHAIDLAWELLTDRLGINEETLRATYFADSREAYADIPDDNDSSQAWRKYLPDTRVIGEPAEDNLWGPAGTSGPFGPCTEVFYDRGDEFGSRTEGQLTEGRDIEIWNAGVFMQLNKAEDGTVSPLDLQSVDAGAGLERIAMILQNAPSIHQIEKYNDVYTAIRSEVRNTKSARVVFDHLKTAQIITASGIFPSNSKEGYVLRKLLRRVYSEVQLSGLALGSVEKFSEMVRSVADEAPHAVRDDKDVDEIFQAEQQRFERAMKNVGKYILEIEVAGVIDAQKVFQAHTQNGVPVEYFRAFAQGKAMHFPEQEIQVLEAAHKQRS